MMNVSYYPNFAFELDLFFRVILACFLGCVIGWERERHRNIITAGIRTYGAIALGSCVFGILSFYASASDPARIAAQVVTGIGFLGGGVIFRQGDYVTGLTTAATLWATAAVGLAVSFGLYLIATLLSVLIYLLLSLPRMRWWKHISLK